MIWKSELLGIQVRIIFGLSRIARNYEGHWVISIHNTVMCYPHKIKVAYYTFPYLPQCYNEIKSKPISDRPTKANLGYKTEFDISGDDPWSGISRNFTNSR